ncbi:YhdT family protein [Lederbergia lenta]|uniref:Sodium/pantothenate symporter n=1 Tax=Lederbergia lenta TaxID=1467 RepID=A0A2X4W0A9_LEDLE|nr:YhdT family protein [Lederbergia lenta]MCM3109417.1 YhdT family protein [Lederbergia lenta]MEC2324818.1 YhdT family protein [Lederbergia lenta]SQI57606.1 sodium/pantothenate symporter [Lederbergia lenta]
MEEKERMDWRFKIAHKEAWIGVILVIIHFLWWFGFAFGLGKKPVEEYSYVFGLPAWFFYSCVLGFIVMVFLVSIAIKFLFKDIPFDDEEGEKK